MADSRFIAGIDLGTTNCVLSYIDTETGDEGTVEIFRIPQITAPGEVEEKPLLPSFIYIPTEREKEGGGLTMPWDPFGDRVIGSYARTRGAEVPGRLVASAKSWLCHQGVDRTSALLPIDAAEDVEKISPIAASASFLRHIKAAWNNTIGKETGERLEDQEVILTIPASFDAVARDLTVRAAASAGIEHLTLLEEPQAAFYAWLNAAGEEWKDMVSEGDLILVCDVGGGTTDFSLIRVTNEDGILGLERVAVGDHILLGGDNMDLALAYVLAQDLEAGGTKLDSNQMETLWHNVRLAKEKILSDASIDSVPVVIPGRGSGLVGGTLRTELTRAQVESLLMDGFLPSCSLDDSPAQQTRVGLQELGLPYASDSAITRYLAQFIRNHAAQQEDTPLSAVLFNGGVFKSTIIRQRVFENLREWSKDGLPEETEFREISGPDLDLAVSQGAVAFGFLNRSGGVKIKGGTAQSYYIGIEGSRLAVPGMPPVIRALCVVPQGMEEGTTASLPDRTFGLIVGQPVEFKFFGSTLRPEDKIGDIIDNWEDTIEPVTTLSTEMEAPGLDPGTLIPVRLEAEITEVGTLALYLVSDEKDLQFKLEFDVRG